MCDLCKLSNLHAHSQNNKKQLNDTYLLTTMKLLIDSEKNLHTEGPCKHCKEAKSLLLVAKQLYYILVASKEVVDGF